MSDKHLHHPGHSHSHPPRLTKVNTAFIVGIILNLLFVVIEFIAGWYNNSMALISDAGHNLVDVFSLVLALVAFRMARVKSSDQMTYGYSKTTILASLVNAVFLFVAIGGIGWESYQRLIEPRVIQGEITIIVASIGIVINAVTAFLFYRDKDHDLNIKGAYLHLLADALVSLGVVVAGIVIVYTQWFIVDTIMSFIIIIVIFLSTWSLFRDSFILTIDGVPRGIDVRQIIREVKALDGVIDFHHVHVWAISTTINAITAHVVVDNKLQMEDVVTLKNQVKETIQARNVSHITLEVETEEEHCSDPDC
jgi:cobalt-zinc-cadmium efflux system protein